MSSPLHKADFLGLDTHTWLYTGAESPPHRGVIAAANAYLLARADGPAGRELNAQTEESCKRRLAALLNGHADDIALLSNASEALSAVVLSLDWRAGDNIVINTLEYPSGVLACLSQVASGVEVRRVQHRDFDFEGEDILAQVDNRTRLVMTSHVSYLSGARLDYQALYEQLKSTSALLLLDATQALGVVPVALSGADFVVSSTYKWLLAMHGGGVLAVNPARTNEIAARAVGWRSVREMFAPDRFERFERHAGARQFELGYPSYSVVYALDFSVNLLLETGIETIEAHVLPLGEKLIAGLCDLGLQVMTPRQSFKRAGNIAWKCERGAELSDALRAEGIFLWGGDGRARASIHGYNDAGDVQTLLRALEKQRDLR